MRFYIHHHDDKNYCYGAVLITGYGDVHRMLKAWNAQAEHGHCYEAVITDTPCNGTLLPTVLFNVTYKGFHIHSFTPQTRVYKL